MADSKQVVGDPAKTKAVAKKARLEHSKVFTAKITLGQ